MVDREREIAAVVLQDVHEPMRKLEIAVARTLGLAQRLNKRLIADPIELSGHCLKTDVGHRLLPDEVSGRASAPLLENFRGMETRIAAIGLIGLGPVRRH